MATASSSQANWTWRMRVSSLLRSGKPFPVGGPVTVDMRPLKFMDSSGIQTIIAAAKLAPEACIVLHGVHDEVHRVVELTGIEVLPNLHVIPCTVGVQPASA